MSQAPNFVKNVVSSVGGPTRVANHLGVSSSTVHTWIKKNVVPNWDRSEKLAEMAKVSAASLRGQ